MPECGTKHFYCFSKELDGAEGHDQQAAGTGQLARPSGSFSMWPHVHLTNGMDALFRRSPVG